MTDYSSWVRRAEQFVRQLNYLPGQWGITVSVDPPLTPEEAEELHESLPLGLPAPLRDFYLTGSASCCCKYYWKPRDADLARLQEVFPSQGSVYGGARIIAARDLLGAHGEPGFAELIEKQEDASQMGHEGTTRASATDIFIDLAEKLPAEIRELVDLKTAERKKPNEKDVKTWCESVPFLEVGNGDVLALHVGSDEPDSPVVYLCHDDMEHLVTMISPSFHEFMSTWEDLCYIGPENWLLYVFLGDNETGPLSARNTKARRWRELVQAGQD